MTNGAAYVFDESGNLERRTNLDARVCSLEALDQELLGGLVREHATRTGSPRARALLADWDRASAGFRKVAPRAPIDTVTPQTSPLAGAAGRV
jgi:glutamate synthase (ferredoxin)